MKEFKSPLPELTLKYKSTNQKKVKISSSQTAYEVLVSVYDYDTIEYLESSVAVFLNRANNTLGWIKLSFGGMSGTIIDAKILFATGLKCGASAIIISHNHPSGNLQPSESDKKITNQLKEVGMLLDLPLLDHIIVTVDGYYSFADNGQL